ncbi:hypothetical protein TNCT_325621 [Trichonephila clavata]|uniref:Uncharacterized protein n=1 Tax=Trichonephila clavata TaxID=2740835 RepID=A0A8X6G0J8_TRICU|nr:hypothetical protein TNCT_138801 [Trichonephila clavata]GFR16852.1 hypothetical protein TNCT_325621 [Trichonephila clavata]
MPRGVDPLSGRKASRSTSPVSDPLEEDPNPLSRTLDDRKLRRNPRALPDSRFKLFNTHKHTRTSLHTLKGEWIP